MLRQGSFLCFLKKLKKAALWKGRKRYSYHQNYYTLRVPTSSFFDQQPASISNLKLKFLSKVLIGGPLILLLTETETSTEHKLLVQLVIQKWLCKRSINTIK